MGGDRFCEYSPRKFIKYYSMIFHVVYKGNVPSFQCNKSLYRSKSMGEVDSLSLIFICMRSVCVCVCVCVCVYIYIYIYISPLIRRSMCHLVAVSEKRFHT
jgi:hypothetical protein